MIIHFYFQCTRMAMNNISTSDGLTMVKKSQIYIQKVLEVRTVLNIKWKKLWLILEKKQYLDTIRMKTVSSKIWVYKWDFFIAVFIYLGMGTQTGILAFETLKDAPLDWHYLIYVARSPLQGNSSLERM